MEKGSLNEKMKTSNEELGGFLGVLKKWNTFLKENGLKGAFTNLMTLFVAVVVGFFIINPGEFFDKFERYNQEKHEIAIKQRLKADPQIRSLLVQLRSDAGADRTYILEAHNGGTNLSNLPFLYADLTYIEPKAPYAYIEAEYKNFRLSRYPWASYVIEHGNWFGSVEDCKDADPELYYRLQKEDVSYMGMFVMYGPTGLPSACLGIVYKEGQEVPTEREVIRMMQKYSSLINPLLISE